MFALIVTGKETRSSGQRKTIVGKEGERYWVVIEDGWVGETSSVCLDPDNIPSNVVTFRSRESAEFFARNWPGHPWWCLPNGQFEVVEVQPTYKRVKTGYKRKRK